MEERWGSTNGQRVDHDWLKATLRAIYPPTTTFRDLDAALQEARSPLNLMDDFFSALPRLQGWALGRPRPAHERPVCAVLEKLEIPRQAGRHPEVFGARTRRCPVSPRSSSELRGGGGLRSRSVVGSLRYSAAPEAQSRADRGAETLTLRRLLREIHPEGSHKRRRGRSGPTRRFEHERLEDWLRGSNASRKVQLVPACAGMGGISWGAGLVPLRPPAFSFATLGERSPSRHCCRNGGGSVRFLFWFAGGAVILRPCPRPTPATCPP